MSEKSFPCGPSVAPLSSFRSSRQHGLLFTTFDALVSSCFMLRRPIVDFIVFRRLSEPLRPTTQHCRSVKFPPWASRVSCSPHSRALLFLKHNTTQVGVVGKYGTRYGASLRKVVKKIEVTQHATYTCSFCGKDSVKREAVGIWNCRACRKTVAGGAFSLRFVGGRSLALSSSRDSLVFMACWCDRRVVDLVIPLSPQFFTLFLLLFLSFTALPPLLLSARPSAVSAT